MGKYNQEDEIADFFKEQDAALESEPEESKDDGLPSIMKALDELPQASSQTVAFAADGMQRRVTSPIGYHYSAEVRFDRKKNRRNSSSLKRKSPAVQFFRRNISRCFCS